MQLTSHDAYTRPAPQVKVAPEGGQPEGAMKPGIPPQTVKVQGRDVTIAPADAKSRPFGKAGKDSSNTKASGSASGSQQKVQCQNSQNVHLACSTFIKYRITVSKVLQQQMHYCKPLCTTTCTVHDGA